MLRARRPISRACGRARAGLSSAAAAAVEPPVVVSVKNSVAVIELNRPRTRNAMTVEVGHLFSQAVDEVCRMSDVRAAVVTGRGSAFSAGGDLSFLLARADASPAENADEMRRFYERFLAVRRLPVPVVAAINGHAVGAGLCLAMACDVRVAASRARLGLTFSELGLHPGMGATHFLPRLVGPEVAARMLLAGEMHAGDDARRVGLVSEVVSTGPGETDDAVNHRVLDAALALANDLAGRSPAAARAITATLRNAQGEGLERALRREADAQAVCYATPEYRAAVQAMQDKVNGAKK